MAENKEQYLTEAHYLTCDKGMMPKRVKIDGRRTVRFSGSLAANANDRQRSNNFICVGKVAFWAGAAAGVAACLIPGPGWVLALIIAIAIAAAIAIGALLCQSAAASRLWNPATISQKVKIDKFPALTLSSQMMCPAQGGCITAQPTFWSAWGTQALTNLGHIANFAFGFLVGKGTASMLVEAGGGSAATGLTKEVLSNLGKQGLKETSKKIGNIFFQTAKKELVEQFNPFRGWKKGAWFCNALRGFGLFGAYKQQWDIWTDDEKNLLEKVQSSFTGLILDVFAAKGMTTTCFPAGTKVHTQWGLANIERLEVGVPVLTYNEATGEREYKKVLKISRRMTQRMCVIELSNDRMIQVTPEHRFFCSGEWIPIEDIQIGNTLQDKNGDLLVIENKVIMTTFVEVFNLEVENNENYYVTEDGILVHNGYREDYVGRTPGKNSKTGKKVFEQMLNEDPPTARIVNEMGQTVKEFWDPDNKCWRDIKLADMGHIVNAVDYWNETGRFLGAKSKEVRKWMLDSENYKLEYFRTNRSKGAKLGGYLPPVK